MITLKEKRKIAQRAYRQTEAGKAARNRYRQSDKGKAAHKRGNEKYRGSEKGYNRQQYNEKHRGTVDGYLADRYHTMSRRCNSPNAINYESYGSAGVELKFTLDEFREHIKNLGIDIHGLEIHRTGKHYELNNIEFLTPAEHKQRHG